MRFVTTWRYRRKLRKVTKLLRELDLARAAYRGDEWYTSPEYRAIQRRFDDVYPSLTRFLDS